MENIYTQKTSNFEQPPAGKEYKMIPTRGVVIFPGQTMHIDVARDKTLDAINKAVENGEDIFLAAQKHSANQNPSPKDIYRVGVLARITQVLRTQGDLARILVTGLARMEIKSYTQLSPHFVVELMPYATEKDDPIAVEAVRRNLMFEMDKFKSVDARLVPELSACLASEDLEKFVALIAPVIYRSDSARQNLLSIRSLYLQLEDILTQIHKESEIAAVEKKIAAAVRASIDKNQREFYLREQLKAIKTELGEDEDEIENYLALVKEKRLPKEAAEKVLKELSRMEKMSPNSPESGVIRTYIEWILDLPWSLSTDEEYDLKCAQEILDEDHFGLKKVKERIIEYLAVHKLTKNRKAPILCFVGPPGVGKTSIVYSIARSAGKKLVTMSLGGVRDEAEIRGHRRTYIGSMPGRIISAMKTAGVTNPVFLLDEVDKMSSDFRGDPSSALLEVLDPNQNHHFKDHYIEIPYDLSGVMFIMTANTLDTIAPPLLDRMEVIELSGYTYREKLQIAQKYLVKKQLDICGLPGGSVTLSDEAISKIIHSYTRESGVRNLEREIGAVVRKVAVKMLDRGEAYKEIVPCESSDFDGRNDAINQLAGKIAEKIAENNESGAGGSGKAGKRKAGKGNKSEEEIAATIGGGILLNSKLANNELFCENADANAGEEKPATKEIIRVKRTYNIEESDIEDYLGAERFLEDERLTADEVGVSTGLAWTSVGGCTLSIEVATMSGGKGEIILTGSLGEVMKESCQTALSLVKVRAEQYNIDPEIFNTHNIHIHFPEGATPKDGPSAGIAITTALLSALSGKKVKSTVAMTGEVTLRGKVLAIGGLKEKSLAAYRIGIKTLIVPHENKKDVKELPSEVINSMEIILAENIDTVLENSLV